MEFLPLLRRAEFHTLPSSSLPTKPKEMETENKWLVASSQCLWDCGSSSTDAQGKHFHELLKQQKLVFLWLQHPPASHAGSVHAIFHIGRICPVPRSLNTRNCSTFKSQPALGLEKWEVICFHGLQLPNCPLCPWS